MAKTAQERLDELIEARHKILVNGQKKAVRGKSVEYADPAKLDEAIANEQANVSGSAGRPRHAYIKRVRI